MKNIRLYFNRVAVFFDRNGYRVLFLAGLVLFACSFFTSSYDNKLRREVSKVEKALHRSQNLIDRYALDAINSDSNWMPESDFPDDMVLYRYQHDTLVSWANQFPVGNDNINAPSLTYRLQYMGNRNVAVSPLAYIGAAEQYINLGSSWYIVNTHLSPEKHVKIVTGILVKKEYPVDNVSEQMNRRLRFGKDFTSVPISTDDSAVVYGVEGEPLFSIVSDTPKAYDHGNLSLRWLSYLMLLLATFPHHYRKRTWRTFFTASLTLLFVRVSAYVIVTRGHAQGIMFSPILYADTSLMNSLGNLLLNNVFAALSIHLFFAMRQSILKHFSGMTRIKKGMTVAGIVFLGIMLTAYIHFVLYSLVINSNIELEPFRIENLSIYSILCFISFAMIFLALLYILQLLFILLCRNNHVNLFSWRNIIIYIVLISLYSVTAISLYGLEKEYKNNEIRTSKLAVDRDLDLELFLRNVEYSIANDPFISVLASVDGGIELIKNRLTDMYLSDNVVQNYNINLVICSPDNFLRLDDAVEPVGCFGFYDNKVNETGLPLDLKSNFYYINNYDGKTSYLGVFTYFRNDIVSRMYLEIEAKYQNEKMDYPIAFLASRTSKTSKVPNGYSYARYSNNRLVSHSGTYDYPVVPVESRNSGYRMISKNGYIHFVNKVSEDDLTIISRKWKNVFRYIISFSYFAILYGLFILPFTKWGRKTRLFVLPKNTLKRKITLLTTTTMIVALVSLGYGSVMFAVRMNEENNREMMDAKIFSVQNAVTEYCKYLSPEHIVNKNLVDGIDKMANVTGNSINLFDITGKLIHSTKPDLYDRNIVGTRMDANAYREIRFNSALKYVNVESVSDYKFYSIYSPVYNQAGQLVAIVNVPYFNRNEDITTATLSTVSAIINICLLLIITAIVIGTLLSNSLTKPIVEIKEKIDRLALPRNKNKHIRYKNSKDELGVLIQSYNKMVDNLESSTRQLAQTEREQAWKEMARQIAHEIKNPLTPMRLSIQYVMRMKQHNVPGWEDKLEKVSESLIEQIDTLSETASEFSSFAKNASENIGDVNLDELTREQVVLFDNRDNIHIKYVQKISEAIVEVRRSQLSRVIVNLVTNAVQAIESSGVERGEIRITLDSCLIDGRNGCSLSVEDNGPGVGEENLPKLFTPDFTTKTSGSGLGLAISKSILEMSMGTINYKASTDLGGACFTIMLPLK